MKRFLLILTALILLSLCACSGKNGKPEEKETGTAGSGSNTGEESGDENEPMAIWRTDVTLQDEWVSTQELAQIEGQALTADISQTARLSVELDELEIKSDKISSSEGGVNAYYPVITMSGDFKDRYHSIWTDFKNYNEFAEENAAVEITDGELRYKDYRKRDPSSSFLFLSSWNGIEFARLDSGIVSYFRTVYRYNREYDPDYHEIYGRTIDTSSGRILTLKDVLTDTDELPEMIWDALVRSGYRDDTDADRKDTIALLEKAVNGCRDDGSFAWVLDPLGIEFGVIESYDTDRGVRHVRERAYIPFRMISGKLRDNIEGAPYDYMIQLTGEDVEAVTGIGLPEDESGEQYSDYFIVQKSGQRYLYGVTENLTDVYLIWEDKFEKAGEVPAEIGYNHYGHIRNTLDPENFTLDKIVTLMQELFLQADARAGEDGVPVRKELYKLTVNPMPVFTGRDIEGEIFPDENTTESSMGVVETGAMLTIERSDGESFVDCGIEDSDALIRLYVEGNDSDGWTVNGIPMDDAIAQQGWLEE